MTAPRILVALILLASAVPAHAHDWNDRNVAWQDYEPGLAAAKKEKKPVCLIVYTEWCPHCKNYSGVFHDPKVVAEAKNFVMIRIDQDKNKDLAAKYAPDGTYIPRTVFLSPDGTPMAGVQAPRDKFKHFFDEKDPASVLAGMAAAEKKVGK